MAQQNELVAGLLGGTRAVGRGAAWQVSWPLLTGLFSYLFLYQFYYASALLRDGDVYWHIATGRWILDYGVVPARDPFSHTMPGAVWTAHEWLSEVVLATVHQWGGWGLVVAMTALAFAATIALLTRALLRNLEPVYALLFAALAIAMTIGHVLARPHVLAMPLMMLWVVELTRASNDGRPPRLWMLPLMTLWANMHGGFTLGLALAVAFGGEALLNAWRTPRFKDTARSWGGFLVLAALFSLLTPHGPRGLLFTWQVLAESSYALSWIGEWLSPNFHSLQPLEIWLLAGLALIMYQGLRLPPVRLAVLLGLLHLSLKHVRNIELLGLLVPLVVAAPFAAQWRERQRGRPQVEGLDRVFHALARPAGQYAVVVGLLVAAAVAAGFATLRPVSLPASAVPSLAVQAAQAARVEGPVLNNYNWGGYLIYSGIPVFIDGRAEMYGDAFMREFVEALSLNTSDALPALLAKYRIGWTLLEPHSAAVALLDHLPEWQRLYADETAVIHVKVKP